MATHSSILAWRIPFPPRSHPDIYVKLFSIIQTLFFIIRTFKIPCSFLFTSELTEPYYIKACK